MNTIAAIDQLNSLTCAVNELTKSVTGSTSVVQQLVCDMRSIDKTVQDHDEKLKVLKTSVDKTGSDQSNMKRDSILFTI
jgi:methyl-accepting chemotaxis protein